MNRQKDIVSSFLKGALLAAFLIIFGLVLFGKNILTAKFKIPNYILFVLGMAVLIACTRWMKFRRPFYLSRKRENLYLLVASFLLFLIQAFVTYHIIFRTSWDVAAVWYGSHWVAMGDAAGIRQMSEYFSIYPNNLLLTFIFSAILKFNMLLGEPFSNGGLLLALIQCAILNFTGVLLFKCAKRFVSERSCWCIYVVYAFLIALSGWMVLPYSDGMGVVFPSLFLYLYLRYSEHQGSGLQYVYILLLAVIGVVAYHIKPYAVIVLIAELIIEIIERIKKQAKERKLYIGKWVLSIGIIVVGIAGSSFVVSSLTHSMGFEIDEQREMSIPHYLMLGANVQTWGGYSDEDLEFGSELNDKKLRNDAELEQFVERLRDMGISGYIELFLHKAAKNYLDGTYSWRSAESFYTEIYPSRGAISDLLRSVYYGFGNLYPYYAVLRQFVWLMVLLLMPFAVLRRNPLNKNEKVLSLSILGLMIYLQIFEAQARYVFVFVPLFLILAFIGYRRLRDWKKL